MDMPKYMDDEDSAFIAVTSELRRWVREVVAPIATELPRLTSSDNQYGQPEEHTQYQAEPRIDRSCT